MYYIADIASNHDGDLKRAKELIKAAKSAGCNAAKFQFFKAETLINKKAFSGLKLGHQKDWKDVYEVYQKYSIPYEWAGELADECKKVGIDFMITPYDLEAVVIAGKYSGMIKVGSGDINYIPILVEIAKQKKPVILSTGASSLDEIITAVNVIRSINPMVILMQCNTNYTGEKENEKYSNVNVLKSFKVYFHNVMTGLSDHTKSMKPAMAAVALGAEFIEKHFTDGKSNSPDNDFSLNANEWKYLIKECDEMAQALGNNFKQVEMNEMESRVIQRRAWVAARNIQGGVKVQPEDLIALRPAPDGSLYPMINLVGKELKKSVKKGDFITGDVL